MLSDFLYRLRALLRRRTVERELDDELRFHRQHQFEQYVGGGMSEEQARRRLAIDFGGLDQTREACRDARGVSMIDHLFRDVRYGLRSLAKAPGYTVVSVLTLALGLGATTAIFSVVYGTLLRPLPYANSAALVVLNETTPQVGLVSVSYPNYQNWRAESRSFSDMSVVVSLDGDLTGASQPETISAEAVPSHYLPMLGVSPVTGRNFTAEEDEPGAASVALLSHALWQTHFAGDPGVVGRTIGLDGRPVTVVGVLPASVRAVDDTDLFVPIGAWLSSTAAATNRGSRGNTVVVGRLAPGVTLGQARTEMEGIAARLARAYPADNAEFGVALRSVRDVLVGDVRPALIVLFGTVVCVLLIACVNVANLSLIRGAARAREIALRIAIGAGRRRIVSQLLVESALVAVLGGAAGLAMAVAGSRALARFVPADALGGSTVALDGAVLAFAALVVMASTLAFGLAPALQAVRRDVTADLNEGGRGGGAGRQQRRWRGALAIAEVALALVLLVGAGLMMRSLARLATVDPGIRTDGVLTTYVGLRAERYQSSAARRQFWRELLDGVGRMNGVDVAALGTGVPMTGDHSRRDIAIDGLVFEEGALPHPDVHRVTPSYTRALELRVLQGRAFTETDDERAVRVGLINRRLAEQHFAGGNPIGGRFAFGRPEPGEAPNWVTIVGVVEDTRMYGLDNPSRLEVYVPVAQQVPVEATLLVRATGDPSLLAPSIRAVVASLDPNQPMSAVATMASLRDASVSTRRVTFVLLALFSALALALAAIGIYGVMSYGVAQRTNELGIRLALGASRARLFRTVLQQGLALAMAGIAAGVVLALVLTRLMRTLLFGVSADDPVTFVAVAAGVALMAALACAVPSLRVLRVNPQAALRRQ